MKKRFIIYLLLPFMLACATVSQNETVDYETQKQELFGLSDQKDAETETDNVEYLLQVEPSALPTYNLPSETEEPCLNDVNESFPDHWADDLSSQFLNLTIDADIDLGGLKAFPVYSIQNESFEKDREGAYLQLLKLLLPDIVKYHQFHNEKVLSQEEWKEALESAVRGTEKKTDSGISYCSWEGQKEWIQTCQEYYKTAIPEEQLYKPISIEEMENKEGQFIVECVNGKKGVVCYSESSINISNVGVYTVLQRESWGVWELWDMNTTVKFNPSITMEEALSTAYGFLSRLESDNVSFVYGEPARLRNQITLSEDSSGYYLLFKQNGGYPSVYTEKYIMYGGGLNFDGIDTNQIPCEMESIELYIDDTGVRWINWQNPMGVTVDEDIRLLPFPELKTCISDLLHEGMRDYTSISGSGYRMTEMRLTAYPQTIADSEEYVLCPVWYLSFEVYGLDPTSNEVIVNRLMPNVIMAVLINAVDGSLVMPCDTMFSQTTMGY